MPVQANGLDRSPWNEAMNTAAMHKALAGSQAGKLTFPEVVGMLIGAGVESYFADLLRGEETFYTTDGETHREQMKLPPSKIAGELSPPGRRPETSPTPAACPQSVPHKPTKSATRSL